MAIFTKADYQVTRLAPKDDNPLFELLWVKIEFPTKTFILGGIYHPPSPMYNTIEFLDYIENTAGYLGVTHPGSTIVVAGDVNTLNMGELQSRTGLTSMVTAPTRGANILDQILTSEPLTFDRVKVVKSVIKTDHSAVIAYSGAVKQTVQKSTRKCEFRKRSPAQNCSFLSYASALNPSDFLGSDPDHLFDNFYSLSTSLLDHFYPSRFVSIASTDPPFMTPEIKSALRKKNLLMKKGNLEEAGALAAKIGTLITKKTSSQLSHLNSKTDSKTLWEEVRALTGRTSKPSPPPGVDSASLNAHYASISTDRLYELPKLKAGPLPAPSYPPLNERTVFYLLDNLQPTATGLDGLPAWYIRLAAPIFSNPLSTLFNQSILCSIVPTQWKVSCIHPLPKIPTPTTPSDYRPISITPILSRILERVIVSNYIYPTLNAPPNLHMLKDQFAFRPTGSTTAAVISFLNCITNHLETQPFVRVIALDFSKAFDSLRHATLLANLSGIGLPDNIYNWIVHFLTDRKHCTRFNDVLSDVAPITASVIQGSVIGPAAFIIAASTLRPVHPRNTILKYADDTYLIVPADCVDTCDEELDNIENWSEKNNLKLNRSKSAEIVFSKKSSSSLSLPPPLLNIPRVSSLKILGVTLNSKLSVQPHVDATLTSCSQSQHALRVLRAHSLSDEPTYRVFNSTILSKLTYCSPAWRGFLLAEDTKRLEAFLRKAKKFNYCSPSAQPLSITLDHQDDKFFHSIITNPSHILFSLLPPKTSHKYNLRQRSHPFSLPPKRSALAACNFFIRMLYRDSH